MWNLPGVAIEPHNSMKTVSEFILIIIIVYTLNIANIVVLTASVSDLNLCFKK